jgi:curved DNA-binding protein CbpA
MDNDTETIKYNSLEFNLYELLNLPIDCTSEQVKKTFRKLIKQFHPDKITDVEEKIYYNLTIANHILGNPASKEKYDRWLLKSNQSHSSLKDNFKKDEEEVRNYFPKNETDAKIEFAKNFEMLGKRHGDYSEDKRSLQNIYKDKEKERVKVSVQKENFSSMDEFNSTFNNRKKNGSYSNMIVKRITDIQPFSLKNSNLAEIKHFDKVYVNDTQYVSAFELMPSDEGKFDNKNIKDRLDDYNSTSQSLKRNNMNFDDLNI